jgi:hypothetical protein
MVTFFSESWLCRDFKIAEIFILHSYSFARQLFIFALIEKCYVQSSNNKSEHPKFKTFLK